MNYDDIKITWSEVDDFCVEAKATAILHSMVRVDKRIRGVHPFSLDEEVKRNLRLKIKEILYGEIVELLNKGTIEIGKCISEMEMIESYKSIVSKIREHMNKIVKKD